MNPTILLLDDNQENLYLLKQMLRELAGAKQIVTAEFISPNEALVWCRENEPDLCLVDYQMPEMSGVEFIDAARQLPGFNGIPIIIITGADEKELRQRALQHGATDFLTRPVDPVELKARAGNLIALRKSLVDPRVRIERLAHDVEAVARLALEREHEQIIFRMLANLSSCRDEETGNHMHRVAHIAQLIASKLGSDEQFCDMIYLAAPMHDIGKVGIPDRILLKPGKLNPQEWEVMKTHTTIGYDVLKDSSSSLLRMGAEIAHSHHEKFNGQGYPQGLKGENIPMAGRIVAVADEMDALLSVRPYKKAWSMDDVIKQMQYAQGKHFDPDCIDVMLRHIDAIQDIQQQYADDTAIYPTDKRPLRLLTGGASKK